MTDFTHSLAVLIGIDAYTGGIPRLTTAVNDATRLAGLLADAHGYETRLLTEAQLGEPVTLARLRDLFEKELPARLGVDDRLLVYFAGHGVALDGDDGPRGYLVPQDARPGDSAGMLPMTDLHAWLTALPCRHMLAILDCCFAGAFRWASTRQIGALPDVLHRERYDRYLRSPAWQVLTSAAYDQTALDVLAGDVKRGTRAGDDGLHSPFALALFDALAGAGDLVPKGQGDGVITATELYLYLREQVEVQAEEAADHEQTPGLWPLNKHRRGEFIFLVPGHPLNLPPAPNLTEEANPYRGLKSYDQKHAPLFFGREDEVKELMQRVERQPFLAVLGASGTGKSSLVKAGLLPRLEVRSDDFSRPVPAGATEVATTNEAYCVLSPIRPTDRPVQALAALLHAELGADLASLEDLTGLSDIVARWAEAHPDQRLVLTIDQFEELATLCHDEAERAHFLCLLSTAVHEQPDAFRLIITLRTDFEPQFTQPESPLADLWPSARYVVPPMDIEDLRQVIEGPASVRVLYFDPPELVDALIKEVIQTPGALPLLSFTLSELYVKYVRSGRDDRSLSGKDYDVLGGVVGSLRNRATEEYDRLPDDAHRATMQRVMLRMVATEGGGELARRRVALGELDYPTAEENARVRTVLDQLVDARLLVRGTTDPSTGAGQAPNGAQGEAYVEPAHDALVLAWDRLLRWKKEAEEYLPLQRRLAQAADEWRKAETDAKPGLLWDDDPRLPQVEETLWPTGEKQKGLAGRIRWARQVLAPRTDAPADFKWLNKVELNFAQASVRARAAFWRRTAAITATVMIALTTLAVFALIQRGAAIDQARIADSRALSFGAIANLEQAPDLSVLLATRAVTSDPDSTVAEDALRQALMASRLVGQRDLQLTGSVRRLDFAADGMRFAVADDSGNVYVGETTGNQPTTRLTFDTGRFIKNLRLGAGGSRLLATASGALPDGGSDNRVEVWDSDSNQELLAVAYQYPIEGFAFDAINGRIAVAGGNKVCLWDIASKTRLTCVEQRSVRRLDFSPRGEYLAVSHEGYKISLWDGALTRQLYEWPALAATDSIRDVAFDKGAELLAVAGSSAVYTWPITSTLSISPTRAASPLRHDSDVRAVAFSPDGRCVASVSDDRTAAVWLRDDASRWMTLGGHTSSAYAVAFLSDVTPSENAAVEPCGKRLATIDAAGILRLWNIGAAEEYLTLVLHHAPIEEIAFSPAGNFLVTASDDGTAQVWSLPPFQLSPPKPQYRGVLTHTLGLWDVDVSPDGRLIATASEDGTAAIWDVASLQRQHTLKATREKGVFAVAFRPPDGRQVATGGYDGSIVLWSTESGAPLQELRSASPGVRVLSIEFNREGTKLVAATDRNNDVVIDLASGQAAPLSKPDFGTSYHAIFDASGTRILAATDHKNINKWSSNAREQAKAFTEFPKTSYSLSATSDGQLVAAGGDGGAIKIWDANSPQSYSIRLAGAKVPVNSVRFSPDNRLLAAADESGAVRFYLTNRKDLRDYAADHRMPGRTLTFDECKTYSGLCSDVHP